MNTISFMFMEDINNIRSLAGIFDLGLSTCKELRERYTLISAEGNPSHNVCTIYDVPYQDIICSSESIIDRYDRFVTRYGSELVDLIVIEDTKVIKNKIRDIILFAIDKVYKSDRILITYNDCDSSSIPDLILESLKENFFIFSQEKFYGKLNHIRINKKEEHNDG